MSCLSQKPDLSLREPAVTAEQLPYLFCRLLRLFGLQGIVSDNITLFAPCIAVPIRLSLRQYWTRQRRLPLASKSGFTTFRWGRWGRNHTSKICKNQNYCACSDKSPVALICDIKSKPHPHHCPHPGTKQFTPQIWAADNWFLCVCVCVCV